MKDKFARQRRRAGLTLIEVLLVLVILVILGSLVGVAVSQQRKKAMNDATKAQIQNFEQSLKLYELDQLSSYAATALAGISRREFL